MRPATQRRPGSLCLRTGWQAMMLPRPCPFLISLKPTSLAVAHDQGARCRVHDWSVAAIPALSAAGDATCCTTFSHLLLFVLALSPALQSIFAFLHLKIICNLTALFSDASSVLFQHKGPTLGVWAASSNICGGARFHFPQPAT